MGQGAYFFGCDGPQLGSDEARFFQESDPWGFILFARNVKDPEQLRALCGQLREAVGRDAPILVDQEGGRVQRLTKPHWRQWLPPLDHCIAAGDNAARAMWLRYYLIGTELRDAGIDVNCAPTADIASPDTHAFLRNRCYGSDVETVTTISRAVADGLMAAGVAPVIKHMPGHGRAHVDSHHDLPRVSAGRDTLTAQDFAPFRALNDLGMAMTAHIVFEAIDELPATTSTAVIQMIRNDIGFDGLLMSDDIGMNALGGTVPERSRASLAAGCDLILHCNGDLAERAKVAAACGSMTPAAQARADVALGAREQAAPIDIDAAEDELRALMNGRVYV